MGNSPVYIGFFSMCLPSTSVVPVTPDRRGANHAVHAVHATGEKEGPAVRWEHSGSVYFLEPGTFDLWKWKFDDMFGVVSVVSKIEISV